MAACWVASWVGLKVGKMADQWVELMVGSKAVEKDVHLAETTVEM